MTSTDSTCDCTDGDPPPTGVQQPTDGGDVTVNTDVDTDVAVVADCGQSGVVVVIDDDDESLIPDLVIEVLGPLIVAFIMSVVSFLLALIDGIPLPIIFGPLGGLL